ncbi:hypothetical protein M1E17_09905 [Arthrobacter sp. D1-29]
MTPSPENDRDAEDRYQPGQRRLAPAYNRLRGDALFPAPTSPEITTETASGSLESTIVAQASSEPI